MRTIVAVTGDFYHNGAAIEEAIRRSLQADLQSGSVKLDVVRFDQLSAALEGKPDAVVIFKEGRLDPTGTAAGEWMTASVEEAVERYVREGGVWIAWHSGLAGNDKESKYYQLLKGYFEYHPSVHQTVTYTAVPGMSSMEGSYSAVDEHYFVACDTDNTQVFLSAASVDGESPAGWQHAYGSGNVICYTPGHTNESMLHDTQLHWLRTILMGGRLKREQ